MLLWYYIDHSNKFGACVRLYPRKRVYLIPCRSIPIYRYLGECTLPGNLFSLFLHLKWADKNSYGYSMRGRCCWSCSRPMRAKACIPIPMSTIVTSRRTMQIPRRRLLWTTVRFAISISSRISILPTGSSTVSSVCWKPFSGRSVTIRQSLRYRARSSVRRLQSGR